MAIYHNNINGPAICKASPGNCPITKETGEQHYNSPEKAQEAYEVKMNSIYVINSLNKKNREATTDKPVASKNSETKKRVVSNRRGSVSTKDYIDNWDEYNFDSSYEAPRIREIEGYLGAKGWAGAKNSSHYTSMATINKMIRNDFKEAQKSNYLPKGVKISIVSDSSSYTDSNITSIDFGDVPFDDMYEMKRRNGSSDYVKVLKPKYKLIEDRVSSIVNNYNYNKSNGSVDYFDTRFYARLSVLTPADKAYNEVSAKEKKHKGRNTVSYSEYVKMEKAVAESKERYSKERRISEYLHEFGGTYEDAKSKVG